MTGGREHIGEKKNRVIKNILGVMLSAVMLIRMAGAAFASDSKTADTVKTARPSVNGALHVEGRYLKDKDGNSVVLRGVSTHGITWYPDFVSEKKFRDLSEDWDCNFIRLAAYTSEYVNGHRDETIKLVKRGVDAAIAADMYVLVDWHVLDEQDPNVRIDSAKEFFDIITSEYPDCPNIIYEICNEPNGEVTWTDVTEYAGEVIPVVRANSPSAVILVGTPVYDRDIMAPVRSPLNVENVMYVLHFYAATHKSDLRMALAEAVDNGLPVFISECGLSEASGDGETDYASAVEWFSYLREHDISFAVWSFSNKNESSALIKPEYDLEDHITAKDLTDPGLWVRSLIQGEDPAAIPVPEKTDTIRNPIANLIRYIPLSEIRPVITWSRNAVYVCIGLLLFIILIRLNKIYEKKKHYSYDDVVDRTAKMGKKEWIKVILSRAALLASMFFTVLYLVWRIRFSIPAEAGIGPVIANVLLLLVEILGFAESLVLYGNLMGIRKHPLPEIEDSEYPDVDIFIATYNEPVELLRRTINGCNHLLYPDRSKVHIWLCDDNRRPEMRKLAGEMGVGYFDRPDNKGAKAGNLNNALGKTSAPYVVTLDADMIPMSHFLMNTIPYFVDADKKYAERGMKTRLGLLQTPQCFYEPDVFQYALYSEKNAPNEQDFFYRTIEVAKTSSNSVIYGGSNTILLREALDSIGGFYTGSITEDFATGMLIEAAGYTSLALPEPMASGTTPGTYKEHIQQRRRWGRGVISTSKKLKLFGQKGLAFSQKLSYFSSVIFWYAPVKCLLYLISPLLFAVFMIPVFKCTWLDLLVYWLPMYIMQDLCLRAVSDNAISLKWSGIYDMSVMPHLVIPVLKETFGVTTNVFEVTDKSGKKVKSKGHSNLVLPFYIFILLSVIGIIRSVYLLVTAKAFGIIVLLFWLIRNLYFLIMALFLVDGRDEESGNVKVVDAELASLQKADASPDSPVSYGVTTLMTENTVRLFIDEPADLAVGDRVKIRIESDSYTAEMTGVITDERIPRSGGSPVYSVVITDYGDSRYEYLQILYDRIPTLPQTLHRDHGIIIHMMINIAHRILESSKAK